jgi:hypothetical protein
VVREAACERTDGVCEKSRERVGSVLFEDPTFREEGEVGGEVDPEDVKADTGTERGAGSLVRRRCSKETRRMRAIVRL